MGREMLARSKNGLLFSIVVVFLLLSYRLNAEELSDSEGELSLKSLMELELKSGSFLELDISKSPLSMTIIEEERIENSNARDLSELLEIYVPGFVYMYNKWNGTVWGLRGIANDRNTKIIVLVNGYKVNAQSRDGYLEEVRLGLIQDIERVEVLRGPAGLVYGSGAIAGIVNIVTKEPDESNTEAYFSKGTGEDFSVEGNIYGTPGENHEVGVSLGMKNSGGIGVHEARIYDWHQWPYPNSLSIDDQVKRGIPVDGSAGSTPGNYKAALDWKWKGLSFYSRYTHHVENAGGWFPMDPWPEVEGTPSTGDTVYNSYPVPDDATINNNWVIEAGDTLGWTIDSISYTSVTPEVINADPDKPVDPGKGFGMSVSPDDPFWSALESWKCSRRQYIHDNLFMDLNYNFDVGDNTVKLNTNFDMLTARISTEMREGYEGEYEDRRTPYIDETWGERRFGFGGMFLLKSMEDFQAAAGLDLRMDVFGNDIEGYNMKEENPEHKIISDLNYYNMALYLEGMYEFNSKLAMHGGLRYDIHTRAKMFNSKVAGIFTPIFGHSIKAMFQTSSNNGSVDNYEYNRWHYDSEGNAVNEAYFERPFKEPSSDTPILPPAPDTSTLHELEPEKVYSFELTSSHLFLNYFSVMPAVSYGMVRDLFAWSQDLFRCLNVGEYDYLTAELTGEFDSEYLSIGVNHAFQRPVNTDVDNQGEDYQKPVVNKDIEGWYENTGTSDAPYYRPVINDTDTVHVNIVEESITRDGENFLNLPTHTTKVYGDITPWSWLTLHADLRVFWGLPGRKEFYKEDKDMGYQVWDIWERSVSTAMKKLNAGINFNLNKGWHFSFAAYNILGKDKGIDSWDQDDIGNVVNSLRWQQMAMDQQRALASVDQRSYEFIVKKEF